MERTWRGSVRYSNGAAVAVLDVEIPADFPYVAPLVKPLSFAAAHDWSSKNLTGYREARCSWHREPSGRMCLFELEDHTRLPWADPAVLFQQIEAWLDQDCAGWPGDEPALDLERYFPRTGEVVIYDDLSAMVGRVVKLRPERNGCRSVGPPVPIARGRRGVQGSWPRSSALVLDLGVLTAPVHDWTTLLHAAGARSDQLVRDVDLGVRDLVLRYRRGPNDGVIALRLFPGGSPWTLHAHTAAPRDPVALTRRSHPQHDELARRKVTVVGVGAIGSVMADLLHRSGVGHLELVDFDLLLPGNAVRHLAGTDHVSKPKVTAVREVLTKARPASICTITTQHGRVTSLTEACDLLGSADLVVDATADSTASALLAAAARAGAGRVVSVAVLADGYAVRVDHWPAPPSGPLADPVLPSVTPGVYETGCSSPVSTPPPAAVWEAAAVGTRHVIDELLAASHCAGEERTLRPGLVT